ncbi:MAG: aldose 1-epimerase family protein [Bacteroidales bacterium]|nr:aldose 1-epimerase family protein [Bacteroidales bacterium]
MLKKYYIGNDFLKIGIKQSGAELCEIQGLSDKKDYLWDANAEVWASHAPVLFPVIGALKEGSFIFEGKKYTLPRHGFVRNNNDIRLYEKTNDCITFILSSSPQTKSVYPFDFEFFIGYRLIGNTIIVGHEIKNTGNGDMFFSLGGHPGFRCPLEKNEKYTDYYLEFEKNEHAFTYKIEAGGLIGEQSGLVLNNTNVIDLHYNLFNNGALVFKRLKSTRVSLVSKVSGKKAEVGFAGFPYLGIWAVPNADFVCIEPWIGIADNVHTDGNLINKEGIVKLAANECFSKDYSITVH